MERAPAPGVHPGARRSGPVTGPGYPHRPQPGSAHGGPAKGNHRPGGGGQDPGGRSPQIPGPGGQQGGKPSERGYGGPYRPSTPPGTGGPDRLQHRAGCDDGRRHPGTRRPVLPRQPRQLANTSSTAPGEPGERVTAKLVREALPAQVIDLLLRQALQDRASDIHVELAEDRLRIRFRIDGILHEVW